MTETILLRRGTIANLPDLQEGEPGYATDVKALYIGSGTGTAETATLCSSIEIDAIQYEPNTFTKATIDAALVAIKTPALGGLNCTLIFRPGTWVIGAAADWSAYTNVTFKIVPGAVISHGAFTVNIPNRSIGNTPFKWLDGSGLVTFSGVVNTVYPEEFGAVPDGVTNSTTGLNYSLATALAMARQVHSSTPNQRTGITLQFSSGTYLTSTGLSIPYDVTGNGYANLLIKGSGSPTGTILARRDGASNIALIDVVGPADTNGERTRHVTIEDLMVDGRYSAVGATGTTYGVLGRGFFTLTMNRVHVAFCDVGVFLTGGSEFKIDTCVIWGNFLNMQLEGFHSPTLWGSVTPVITDRSFIEDGWVTNTQFYFADGYNLRLNHAEHVSFRDCYFQTPDTAYSSISIMSQYYDAVNSAYTANVLFEHNWFEGTPSVANSIYQIIDVQALDTLEIYGLKFKDNLITSSGADNSWHFVNLGDNAGTGHIVDTELSGNTFIYSADNTYPGLLKEGRYTIGTIVQNNSPIGSYGGSRFGPQTTWGDFPTQLTGINTYPESLAEGAVFATTGGWTVSDAAAITRAANADTLNGLATIEIGNGAQAGALTLDYLLDVSRYREKVILITFMVYSDIEANKFITLNPTGGNDLCTTATDNLFSRLSFEVTTSASDSGHWRRVALFVPINPVPPGGGSAFGTAASATLNIRFQRINVDATKVVRIADLQVFVTNRYYNRLYQ